jgi:ABC-type transport system involved in cytochrome c biogenesis ATPase subunit
VSEYNFISRAYRADIPTDLKNTFIVRADDWNDYNNYVRFDLFFCDEMGERSTIGKVKILQRRAVGATEVVDKKTELPEEFANLGDDYISLGQSEDYYEQLREKFGSPKAIEVLTALRDISELPGIVAPFETSPPFRNGMMRENSAKRARRFGGAWIRGQKVPVKPAFRYNCQLGQTEILTMAEFDFANHGPLPGRIVAIVGRNAVGKTAFLSLLAGDLAQIDRVSEKRQSEKLDRFPDGRPLFARVIAISYSAFDRFRRPEPAPHSSYVYSGIRDDRGNMTHKWLRQAYDRNRERIRDHDREQDWIRFIQLILGEEHGVDHALLFREIHDTGDSDFLDELSSGQAILCHFVTALLAWIEPESIILFDEPETHLHPNAVANLFLVLSDILREYESYAIVATHSPVVLQEVPSRRVIHFVRNDETTVAELLPVESFGESVTELTRHVFKTFEVPSLYKRVLASLADQKPVEEVLELFPNGLGVSAQSYLLAQYAPDPDA